MKVKRLILAVSGALFLSPFVLGAVASPASAASAARSSDTVVAERTITAQSHQDYRRGYRDGYRDGWNQARRDCDFSGRHMFHSRGDRDYARGYDQGFRRGYAAGFDEYCDGNGHRGGRRG